MTVNCPLISPDPGASLTARRLYCAFHKHANTKVQKPPSQLTACRFEFPKSDLTIYLPSGFPKFSVKW